MENKLNDGLLQTMLEEAEFAKSIHGGEWSNALCQSNDGLRQYFAVISEDKNEEVISTGGRDNQSSSLCDYLELCSPDNIIAAVKELQRLRRAAEDA